MKIIAITQARIGSTRFPSKILKTIGNKTLLDIHLNRLNKSKKISKLIVATTFEDGVEQIINIAKRNNASHFQGGVNNVLDRFYQAARTENPDYVVRLTSDCPLIDSELVDKVIEFAIEKDLDYCSNCLEEKYPDGQDIELFKFEALEKTWKEAQLPSEKEHVSSYMYKNSTYMGKEMFTADTYPAEENYNDVRLTVDEKQDFEVIKELVDHLGIDSTWEEYTEYYIKSGISTINGEIIRNEGYKKSLIKDKENG